MSRWIVAYCVLAVSVAHAYAQEEWYRYPPQPLQVAAQMVRRDAQNTHWLIRFPSLMETPEFARNQTVYAEVFIPHREARMPAVVILHSWGVHKPDIEISLARFLARRGFVAAVMTLPYHVQRTPEGYLSGELMIVPDISRMRQSMRQAVLDTRRLIDWLQEHPQVSADRVGLIGISLGAIVGALVLGVEHRIQAGVLVLGGGNLAHILWRSPLTMNIRADLRQLGYNYERLKQEVSAEEPLTYLRRQYGERVLMINGRYDLVIPREDASALRDALGEGPILWLNTGHYAPALVKDALFDLIERFLSSRLKQDENVPFRLPATLGEPTLRVGVLYSREWGARVSIALDIWRWEREGRAGVSLQVSPRNLSLLVGGKILPSLQGGIELSTRSPSGYLLFHFVL